MIFTRTNVGYVDFIHANFYVHTCHRIFTAAIYISLFCQFWPISIIFQGFMSISIIFQGLMSYLNLIHIIIYNNFCLALSLIMIGHYCVCGFVCAGSCQYFLACSSGAKYFPVYSYWIGKKL